MTTPVLILNPYFGSVGVLQPRATLAVEEFPIGGAPPPAVVLDCNSCEWNDGWLQSAPNWEVVSTVGDVVGGGFGLGPECRLLTTDSVASVGEILLVAVPPLVVEIGDVVVSVGTSVVVAGGCAASLTAPPPAVVLVEWRTTPTTQQLWLDGKIAATAAGAVVGSGRVVVSGSGTVKWLGVWEVAESLETVTLWLLRRWFGVVHWSGGENWIGDDWVTDSLHSTMLPSAGCVVAANNPPVGSGGYWHWAGDGHGYNLRGPLWWMGLSCWSLGMWLRVENGNGWSHVCNMANNGFATTKFGVWNWFPTVVINGMWYSSTTPMQPATWHWVHLRRDQASFSLVVDRIPAWTVATGSTGTGTPHASEFNWATEIGNAWDVCDVVWVRGNFPTNWQPTQPLSVVRSGGSAMRFSVSGFGPTDHLDSVVCGSLSGAVVWTGATAGAELMWDCGVNTVIGSAELECNVTAAGGLLSCAVSTDGTRWVVVSWFGRDKTVARWQPILCRWLRLTIVATTLPDLVVYHWRVKANGVAATSGGWNGAGNLGLLLDSHECGRLVEKNTPHLVMTMGDGGWWSGGQFSVQPGSSVVIGFDPHEVGVVGWGFNNFTVEGIFTVGSGFRLTLGRPQFQPTWGLAEASGSVVFWYDAVGNGHIVEYTIAEGVVGESHHYAIVRDTPHATRVRCYVDGVQKLTSPPYSVPGTTYWFANNVVATLAGSVSLEMFAIFFRARWSSSTVAVGQTVFVPPTGLWVPGAKFFGGSLVLPTTTGTGIEWKLVATHPAASCSVVNVNELGGTVICEFADGIWSIGWEGEATTVVGSSPWMTVLVTGTTVVATVADTTATVVSAAVVSATDRSISGAGVAVSQLVIWDQTSVVASWPLLTSTTATVGGVDLVHTQSSVHF